MPGLCFFLGRWDFFRNLHVPLLLEGGGIAKMQSREGTTKWQTVIMVVDLLGMFLW